MIDRNSPRVLFSVRPNSDNNSGNRRTAGLVLYCFFALNLLLFQADARYEMTTSVKAQMKFLEELDSLERKRHDEVQRGVLLRAAKVDNVFAKWFCVILFSRALSHYLSDHSGVVAYLLWHCWLIIYVNCMFDTHSVYVTCNSYWCHGIATSVNKISEL